MKMRSSVVDEVEFYESLDRILSSSCSSTSASDDEADHRHRHRFPPPSPAAVAAAYEVWIAEPGPVEERRRRLLQMMGLTGDKALSRGKPPIAIVNSAEIPLSVSYKEVYRRMDQFSSSILFSRSRSDGDVDSSAGNRQLLVPPRSPVVLDVGDDPRCTIRNLDTGREFVVKEFRDDGMWKNLREIGTGQQLTMEEFEMCMGRSPIVQELMRRQSVHYCGASAGGQISGDGMEIRLKKRRSWLKSITNMAGIAVHQFDKRSSDERDSSSERGRRSSSATDDSQDGSDHLFHGAERIRARRCGKSYKELSGLYLTQDIQAHTGSIWSIRFSLDGRYLASAGEDCVIHVWQALERKRKGCLEMEGATGENGNGNGYITAFSNGTPEVAFALACMEANHWEKKRPKISSGRKSFSLDNIIVPELFFALEEKPLRSFKGHLDDVLDLCWSKSQYLLSSSMDKTVRLWHMSSITCLKIFSHSDYVTCIQFNPVDDRYFISGSLDKKIRIWSVADRRVVDWNDLHEMVTAACYTPDGKGALVGSHKGSCYLYDTTDNKLHQKTQIDLQNKKKKSSHKKITGFQFAPGSNTEVFVTSADSRIRVVNGVQLVHKLKGFRNTSSQISASLTANGNYAVCASEDSHVYVWSHCFDPQPRPKCNGSKNITQSYEHFQCRDVTAAIPWPNTCNLTPGSTPPGGNQNSYGAIDSPGQAIPNSSAANLFGDRASATWPEEELTVSSTSSSPRSGTDPKNGGIHLLRNSAWGMVIVTAGRGGQIRTFQNFGFPVKS
ncbi:WD repeat-containing protein 44-like isoform X1 [Dendrobium catenatum]|uniref:Protein Mut11 n=1 Tax=Dendrobium catenatum TaxID=906689 RepID=A0A2I0W0V3_9ASPA|nr:WD repeat-containing protein 44-like isoform X1 [Dendrobium catenatum]PKU69294.1 Protein Mut11 [Dendrobium catenatum]